MSETTKKILVIIQRSNGDVFLSHGLIKYLSQNYQNPYIDLLVNDDTHGTAQLIPGIRKIYTFSYKKKRESRISQEIEIFKNLFRKYDLSINLTASDRSVIYAYVASNFCISAVENVRQKSWWKQILMSKTYFFDDTKHILLNNYMPLDILRIKHKKIIPEIEINKENKKKIEMHLRKLKIKNFLIFHPSAQYTYKIYPKFLQDQLLSMLANLNIDIVVTGGNSKIDRQISKYIFKSKNIHNLIGKTTLEDYLAISSLSLGYIGMDTLNMHIAASQNKRVFAIYGPTNLKMWSPWSNISNKGTIKNSPIQNYDNTTIFQANLPCVACGQAGCDDNHGKSECLYQIDPKIIFSEIEKYLDTF